MDLDTIYYSSTFTIYHSTIVKSIITQQLRVRFKNLLNFSMLLTAKSHEDEKKMFKKKEPVYENSSQK